MTDRTRELEEWLAMLQRRESLRNDLRSLSDLGCSYCARGKSGALSPDFSLHRTTMRLEILKYCPRSPTRLAAGTQVRQAPRSTSAPHDSTGSRLAEPGSGLAAIYEPLLHSDPLVIAQLGQTLDGRIATHTGHSHYVTGPETIVHLHRLRALVDAVVVGAGTAIADNPRLTVRRVPGQNPVRVVLDPSARVPLERELFRDAAAPTIWVVGMRARMATVPSGVEVLRLAEFSEGGYPTHQTPGDPTRMRSPDGWPTASGGFRPADVLQLLAAQGLNRVLVEGGGITVSRFLDAGVLNRLHLTIAPLLLGSGRASLSLNPIDHLDQALRPRWRRFLLGADLLYDLELDR